MDKTMFKGYVRELVREMIEEEVKRVLPKVIEESVRKDLKESASYPTTTVTPGVKPKPSRAQLASMLGLAPLGESSHVAAPGPVMQAPPGMEDNPAIKAINKDYSAIMKKLNGRS